MERAPERSHFLAAARSRERLDRDYTTRTTVPSFPAIIADWTARTADAKCSHAGHLEDGLAYGPHPRERIDLYRAPNSVDGPVLVFIHGGFWQAVSRDESGLIAPGWTSGGVNVAVLDYALAPEVSVTTITQQVLRGLDWLSAEAPRLRLDPRRIVVAGHSVGAHLAAMSRIVTSSAIRPAGLMLISGVFDLAPIARCYVNDTVRLTDDEMAALSPAWHWPKSAIPTFVAFAEHDPLGFHEQSRALAWAWREHGCNTGTVMLPDRNHFSILEDLGDPKSVIGAAVTRMLE
jgi:arylformamidase